MKKEEEEEEEETTSDKFEHMISAYDTVALLSALLAAFGLSFLPTVMSAEGSSLLLGASAFVTTFVVASNFVGIVVLSMTIFYFNQLFEKCGLEAVSEFRAITKSFREKTQKLVVLSIPAFALAVSLYLLACSDRNFIFSLSSLFIFVMAVVITQSIFAIRNKFKRVLEKARHKK